MDVNKLTQGEKIAAGSAILLFIAMFLSWFGAPDNDITNALGAAGVDTSANAWQSFDFIDLILLLTVLVAVGAAVVKASDARVDFPLSTVVTVLGALSTLLVLYRILDPPFDASRKFGVFLGLILAAALTYGAYRAMQEEGATFQGAADRFQGPGDREPRDRPPRDRPPRDRPPSDPGAPGGPGSGEPPSAPPPPPPPASGGPPPAV